MQLFAGVDIGTNGVRLLVVNSKLEIKYEKNINHNTVADKPGWAEQDPVEVYKNTLKLLQDMVGEYPEENIYITFSSVMHSIMGVNKEGTPQTPLIIWADIRSRELCKDLEENYGRDYFYKRTGCPLHSSYWPAKILWMRDFYRQGIKKFVSIKEFIIKKLTGKWMVDLPLASTSGLISLSKKVYDSDILGLLKLKQEELSPLFPSSYTFEIKIKGKWLKCFLGSTDGVLANLGAGALEAQSAVLTAGTSAAVRFTSNNPVVDPRGRAWCYLLDDKYYVIGEATNGAGILLQWLKKILGYSNVTEMLTENNIRVPYQGNELIFIPTMMGERGPNYREDLRGLFYGMSLNHNQRDLIIGFIEGIAFYLKMVFEDVQRVNKEQTKRIILTGGLGLSPLFKEILPYMFAKQGDLGYRPGLKQNTALGAAMMAIKYVTGKPYQELVDYLPSFKTLVETGTTNFSDYLNSKYEKFFEVYNQLINS